MIRYFRLIRLAVRRMCRLKENFSLLIAFNFNTTARGKNRIIPEDDFYTR